MADDGVPAARQGRMGGRAALSFVPLYLEASAALTYAAKHGIPGLDFARFGRRLGFRLLPRHLRLAGRYLLNPVNSVRFFEFQFAWDCLSLSTASRCLDVSSPRLFTLYAASRLPHAEFVVINPDRQDLEETQTAISALGLGNVSTTASGVEALKRFARPAAFDCIWSVSVIEHIAGAYDDSDAIRWMFAALKPGGRLILTVPVDRLFWNEYRDEDAYGTQPGDATGRYFFQRFYDEDALRRRLFDAIGHTPAFMRWFGEKNPGHFQQYINRWLREGGSVTAGDPRDIADNYARFDSWKEMPGSGVVGLMFQKSVHDDAIG